MPRAIWSGAISFGLVSVPVKLYSAVSESDLHFHWIHVEDHGRIGYEKVCKLDGKPVADDELSKAYEMSDGDIVLLDDEDFEAAAAERNRMIDISDFVPLEDIDPIFFERTFYLGPGDGGDKVYALLAKAMEKSGLVALATYVMRDRENLGCLRVRDGVITLSKMYFADEIRETDEIEPSTKKVAPRELEMALELVERFKGTFEPEKYRDTYRDALLDVIHRKHKGEKPERFEEPEQEAPPDLMEALRASVESATRRARAGGPKRRAASRTQSRGGRKQTKMRKARR